jgi:uncharacterized hydrophobic protein (TIGR00341 family)
VRLIEAVVARAERARLDSVLEDLPVVRVWTARADPDGLALSLLVRSEDSGHVLDVLEQRLGTSPVFRAVALKVEATLPRLNEPPAEAAADADTSSEARPGLRFGISREELYARASSGAEVSQTYLLTVALSTIVAAVGLWRDDRAVIIGAMVIAPLLGPNVALALATTLTDQKLTRNSLRANLAGLSLALAISLAVGLIFAVDPSIDAIESRTRVGAADLVLALAAGCAGALAYTTSVPAALLGVMVAVSLLPPLVVLGLLVASGHPSEAIGSAMLLLTNVICVNLAGVVTFPWQGVQPRTWWEARRARARTRRAILVWVALLVVLIIVMWFSRDF